MTAPFVGIDRRDASAWLWAVWSVRSAAWVECAIVSRRAGRPARAAEQEATAEADRAKWRDAYLAEYERDPIAAGAALAAAMERGAMLGNRLAREGLTLAPARVAELDRIEAEVTAAAPDA